MQKWFQIWMLREINNRSETYLFYFYIFIFILFFRAIKQFININIEIQNNENYSFESHYFITFMKDFMYECIPQIQENTSEKIHSLIDCRNLNKPKCFFCSIYLFHILASNKWHKKLAKFHFKRFKFCSPKFVNHRHCHIATFLKKHRNRR